MTQALLDWLQISPIDEIVIVSPHLDDAAFSSGGLLLSRMAPKCRVVTIFTETSADADPGWALATGFANTVEEFGARRSEDAAALTRIGIRFDHAGMRPDQWDAAAAAATLERFITSGSTQPQRLLCLLPAAAGGQRMPGIVGRLWRRVRRRPLGWYSHPEHRIVRDLLAPELLLKDALVGFYGELPYIWNDTALNVERDLQRLVRLPLLRLRLSADLDGKAQLAQDYASQVIPILGSNPKSRARMLSHDEEYFIASGRRTAA